MMPPEPGLPSEAAMRGLMDELDQALASVSDTQRRLMSLTGTGWSSDGLVKAKVGPRGQLIDLDIDPRVFRRPDALGLQASILGAVNAAIQEVGSRTREIMFGQLPPEVAELRAQFQPGREDPLAQMLKTDAEIIAGGRDADG